MTRDRAGAGSVLRRLWPFTAGLRRWLAILAVLGAVAPGVQAAEIWLFKVLVDEVLVPVDLALLPPLAAVFVALSLLSAITGVAVTRLAASTGETFVVRLREAVFGHLLRLSPAQVHRRPVGDLLARMSGDIGAVEAALVAGPPSAVEQVVRLVVFGAILVWLSPALALLALASAPLVWLLARHLSTRIRAAARERRVRTGRLQAHAEEVVSSLAQVQASRAEEHEMMRFRTEADAARRAELQATSQAALLRAVVDVLELVVALAIVAAGAWTLSAGRLTLGELLAFLTYLTLFHGPLRELTALAVTAHRAAAGGERILEILDEPPPRVAAARSTRGRAAGGEVHVAFDAVSFRYDGCGELALDSVSFEVPRGRITAIAGPSGSGKSTVVSLLLRLSDPAAGRIRLDGDDISELDRAAVRASMAVLLEDTYLFDGTVADNVAYPPRRDTPGDIATALIGAGALAFVAALPSGARTPLGPKGTTLSGGQRRRLALARALHAGRPLLVLDEPSAGLDPAATRTVVETVRSGGRTVLLVTHDPELLACADHLVRLDRGRLSAAPAAPAVAG